MQGVVTKPMSTTKLLVKPGCPAVERSRVVTGLSTRSGGFAGVQRVVSIRSPGLKLDGAASTRWRWEQKAIATGVVEERPVEGAGVISPEGNVSILRLIRFVLPMCGLWVVSPVLSLIDTAVVGTRSSIELAALGPGVMMLDGLSYLSTFLGTAVTNKASLHMSRKNVDGAGKVVSDAIIIGMAIGTITAICLYAACPAIIKAIAGEASAALVGPATAYVRIRAIALPAFMVAQVAQSYFLAAQDAITPLSALLLAASLNLVGDIWLVAGLGWGINGAAAATAAAQIATSIVLVKALYSPLAAHSVMPGHCASILLTWPGWRRIKDFLKTCGPIFGTLLVKVAMYSSLSAMATGLSPVHSGAHHIVMSLFLFFCFVGETFGVAAQTFLPGFIGRPKLAWKLSKTLQLCALVMAIVVGLTAGLMLFSCPFVFTKSPAVAATLIEVVPFFASVMFFQCASMVTEGLLLAGRDGSYVLQAYIVNITSSLLMATFLRSLGLGLPALWWCVLQFQCLRLFFNWGRMLLPGSILNTAQSLTDDLAKNEGM